MNNTKLNDAMLNSLSICQLNYDKRRNLNLNNELQNCIRNGYYSEDYDEIKKIISKLNPDILIVCLNSNMNYHGIYSIKDLRENDKYIPIIVIVDQITSKICLEFLKYGIEECIVGEVDIETLKNMMVKVIKKYIYNANMLCKNKTIIEEINIELLRDFKKTIRTLLASYLKTIFGIGPKNTIIEVSEDKMTISILDCFTAYEKSLIESGYHKSLLESSRHYIYIKRKEVIEDSIMQLTSLNTRLMNINIDSDKLVDELIFEINI